MRHALLAAVTLTLLLGLDATAFGWPNCNAAVAANSDTGADPASGFQWSILFMMGSVLTLAGVLVGFIVRTVKRAEALDALDTMGATEAADAGA